MARMHDDDVNLIDGTGINLDDPPHSPLPACSPLCSPPSPNETIAENEIPDAPAPSYEPSPAVWQSVDAPNLARGGGNFSNVTQSTREIDVQVKDGTNMWVPRGQYQKDINTLKDRIEKLPTEFKSVGGTEHPLLGVNSFSITYVQSTMIARKVYPNRKTPVKAFGQLMCYLGMRSRSNNDTKVRTLSFDRHGWNERGYRLVKNGDAKGGKPKINYIPFV
jgi:hypothetical protein